MLRTGPPNIYTFCIYLITDTCFGLIGPHQCDEEYPIDRKILSAMGDSNPGLKGESPVFYHYTNKSPADKLEISMNTQRTQITEVMSKA